jgi:hypothetical protein
MSNKPLILSIELVPSTCWFSNVRSHVSKKQWDTIRNRVAVEAWNVCEICGGVGKKHPVECHEVWKYHPNLIQELERMISLCPNCHMVKHIGLAQVQGRGAQALKHLMNINKLKKKEAEGYITYAFALWAERSKYNWQLDISILGKYGIDVSKLK